MSSHPRDWVGRIPGVTLPAGATAAQVVQDREQTADDIRRASEAEEARQDAIAQAQSNRERRERDAKRRQEREDEEERIRRKRMQAEEAELDRRIAGEGPLGSATHLRNASEADALGLARDMVERMTAQVEQLQHDYRNQLAETQKAQLAVLEARLEGLRPATSAATVHPLEELAHTIQQVAQVRESLSSLVPIVPQAGVPMGEGAASVYAGMSPRERLEMSKVEEEGALRRLDLEDRIQERKDARLIRHRELELRDKQLDGLFEGLKELGPLFGALFAGKVPEAWGSPGPGPEAAMAGAAGIAWTCPKCESRNLAPVGAGSDVCKKCHQMVLFDEGPQAGAEQAGPTHPPGFQGAPPPGASDNGGGTPPPAGWQEV